MLIVFRDDDGQKTFEIDSGDLDEMVRVAKQSMDPEVAETALAMKGQALSAVKLAKSTAAYFLVDDSFPDHEAIASKVEWWLAQATELKNLQVHADDLSAMALGVVKELWPRKQHLDALVEDYYLAKEDLGPYLRVEADRDGDLSDEACAVLRRGLRLWAQITAAADSLLAALEIPSDSGVDFIPGRDEEQELIDGLVDVLREREISKREAKRAERIAAHRAPPPVVEAAHCAELGCNRGRVFFDEDGTGYCKRHGNEHGLRPHGKVT